jgi:hypothetical protein
MEPTDPPERVQPAWLAGSALAALGPDGRLLGVAREPEYPGERSRALAEALGEAYVRTIPGRLGPTKARLEKEHGGPIAFETLRACGTSRFLRSSFEPLSLSPWESTGPTSTAGRWLITFCQEPGIPAVFVNLFAASTLTEALRFTPLSGGDVYDFGVPKTRRAYLRSPESAVALVFRATGARIVALPQAFHDLFTIGPLGSMRPLGAFWRVEVETDVTVSLAGGGSLVTKVFYVGIFPSSPAWDRVHVAGPPLAPFMAVFFRWDSLSGLGFEEPIEVTPRQPLSLIALAP